MAAEPGLQSIHSRSCVTANPELRADAAAVSEIAAQHHERNQPPDRPLTVRVRADEARTREAVTDGDVRLPV